MGYTQYWRVKEDLPDFDEFAAIVMKIVSPYDGNGTRVFSNAVGKILVKGNSVKITGTYEPFYFHNKKQDHAFCKTAREPYDKYVTSARLPPPAAGHARSRADLGEHRSVDQTAPRAVRTGCGAALSLARRRPLGNAILVSFKR